MVKLFYPKDASIALPEQFDHFLPYSSPMGAAMLSILGCLFCFTGKMRIAVWQCESLTNTREDNILLIYMEDCMPSLQVKNIPDELYEKISQTAQMENRSIDEQTVVLLENGLRSINKNQRNMRLKSVFREIDKLALRNTGAFPGPAGLIREDRDK
jgi:hypothetical protein